MVRITNADPDPLSVRVTLVSGGGQALRVDGCNASTIASSDLEGVNPIGQPTRISPRPLDVHCIGGDGDLEVHVEGQSFTVVNILRH